jgi:hypothetical protein
MLIEQQGLHQGLSVAALPTICSIHGRSRIGYRLHKHKKQAVSEKSLT